MPSAPVWTIDPTVGVSRSPVFDDGLRVWCSSSVTWAWETIAPLRSSTLTRMFVFSAMAAAALMVQARTVRRDLHVTASLSACRRL